MNIRPVAALLLTLATTTLAAEPPRNAALDYNRAALLAHKTEVESAVGKLDWDKIGANLDPAKMPPEYDAAKKEISDESVRHFLLAASTTDCDFQPHTEEGWKMVLPELAMLRSLSRQVRLDARVKLMASDAPAAAARIAALYHAAAHAAREDTLISTLVGAAIANSADDETKVLAASGRLNTADTNRILEALRALKDDGLRFHQAVEGERRITSGWLKKEYSGADGPARFVREFVDMSKETPEPNQQRAAEIGRLTPQQFTAAASRMDDYYTAMLAAWDGPDAIPALKALEQRLEKGEFGPLAAILAPAMSKARSSYTKVNENLAAAEAALVGKR